MPMPALTARKGDLLRDGIFIVAIIKADPDTAAEVGLVEPEQTQLEATIDARRKADKVAIESGAVVDHRLGALRREIVAFGVKVFGHFGSRTAAGYLRVYPEAPSKIANANEETRTKKFDTLRKAAADQQTPKELAEAAKALDKAFAAFDVATTADGVATAGLETATGSEDQGADNLHTAVRKLRGRLIMLFPRDMARVNSYLPKAKAPPKPKKVPVVEPVPE